MPISWKSAGAAAAATIFAAMAAGPALALSAEDAFGKWMDPKTGTHIELYACEGGLCAKVIKAIDQTTKAHAPAMKDAKNPDPALRNRTIEGVIIMQSAKKAASKPAWTGNIYSPTKGKTYKGTLTVKGKEAMELQGCIVWPLCRTAGWTRLPMAPAGLPVDPRPGAPKAK